MNTEYFIQEFYQYAGYPKYNKYNKTYSAGCPVCREGNSWGRKRRLYYLVESGQLFCHNCGWSGGIIKWLMQVASKSYEEIRSESKVVDISNRVFSESSANSSVESLPKDSINLFDKTQVSYWKDNKVVKDAISTIVDRRLHLAVNRAEALYVSLNDVVHKNRICLPFNDKNGNVVHYQTRSIYKEDKPNYLSKVNSEKTLFNFNKVDPHTSTVYITEGPIDACFIKNCVAVAGIQPKSAKLFSEPQQKQIDSMLLVNRVWVLDSQQVDKTSWSKTNELVDQGEKVFIWPKDIGTTYKDLNEYCVLNKLNTFPEEIIQENTYVSDAAKFMLRMITPRSD